MNDPRICYPFPGRTKIIACAVVVEELRSRLPAGVECEVLDFGLHRSPEMLRSRLQEAIDRAADCSTIVLAYGLCGMAAIGLRARQATLVIPRADDCIAIFLGSRDAYLKRQSEAPGTLFLSKGWIEGRIDDAGSSTAIYRALYEKYGEARAMRMLNVYEARQPLRHYRQLAFITTSAESDLGKYKEIARRRADDRGLVYQEIAGSTAFMDKIAAGSWDDDFVVAGPGHTISFADFCPGAGDRMHEHLAP